MDYSRLVILANTIVKYSEDKKIIIFGAGPSSLNTLKAIKIFGQDISYFVDNDKAKCGTSFFGKKVESLNTLLNEKKEEILILIASTHYEEISLQLEENGFIEKKHFIKTFRYNEYANENRERNEIINGVEVGKFSYGVRKHCLPGGVLKRIGAFCSFNDNIIIGEMNHPTDWVTTHPIAYLSEKNLVGKEGVKGVLEESQTFSVFEFGNNGDIIIGNDVWIGTNVVILPSVTVGNGVIIAAGAVVTKNIPDYAIVGGVPARVIRYRFSPKEIDDLNKISWWDWENEKIIKNIHLLRDPKRFIEEFLSV